MRHFLLSLFALAATCAAATAQSGDNLWLVVGSYGDVSAERIRVYELNQANGSSRQVGAQGGIADASFQRASRNGRFLYSVNESDLPADGKGNGDKAYAYAFERSTARLTPLNSQPTEGRAPCNIWIDSRRRIAVTANYNGGSISAFPIAADGSLRSPKVFHFKGGTPGSVRQEASHLHCVYASPDERYLFANDLGTDRIYKYVLEEQAGTLSLRPGTPAYFSLPAGEGPRHAVFHPNGRWLYLLGELSGNVTLFNYEAGNLAPIQTIEADSLHAAGSADIHITPDGRFLYASNRLKGDGLAIFAIDPDTGRLRRIGYQHTGIHPRNFLITPNGKYLLCACRDSNFIQVFAIDPKSGLLRDTDRTIKVEKPVCLTLITP